MSKQDPFKYFKTSPEIIRLAVMLYVRCRFHFEMLRICCMNVASMSATKRFDIGGTASVRCLLRRSENDVLQA